MSPLHIQNFYLTLFLLSVPHKLPLIFIVEKMKCLLRYYDKSASSAVMINGYHYRNRWVAREIFLLLSSYCVFNACDLWAVLPFHT